MNDFFADKARDWDTRPVPLVISSGVGAALRERIPWSPTMQVMDFGAGTGLISAHIAPLVAKIWAVDVSEAMLATLAQKDELRGKVETVCQDILAKPLDEKVDVVMSAMALHHVEDTRALFARFGEHLVEGGHLALADLDPEDGSFHGPGAENVFHHGFEREAIRETLEAVGFANIQFSTAAVVTKEDKRYPIFLVTAVWPA